MKGSNKEMEKIRFLNDHNVYDGKVSVRGNVIALKFTDTLPPKNILTNGFELLNENNGIVQGNYAGYTTIYRTHEDDNMFIELSNDGSIYTPPVIPDPVPEPEPYVPTPEELETMFQQNKVGKITLSKSMLADYLEKNPIHSTAHKNTEGIYSVTSEKQSLMMSNYMTYQIKKNIDPNVKLRWNETGKSCEDWTEEEFLQLILEVEAYVSPLVSYQQHLEEEIYECTNQEELDGITIDYYSVGK